MAEKYMLEKWVLGGGKLVGWPVHTDFLRPTVQWELKSVGPPCAPTIPFLDTPLT